MRVVDYLIKSIRNAAVYNSDFLAPPACIIWTDRERQWEAVIPRLLNDMPELFILGKYNPEMHTGPGIWLRCAIAGKVPETKEILDAVPVLYLPGIGRQDLREVENCPEYLKPLVELQYRGSIWSQLNGKDWTILAFLKSEDKGMGLDVSQDSDTKSALQLSLSPLLDKEIEYLQDRHLDKDYFNTLLTGGDPVRELLQWLDQGDVFKTVRGEGHWKAFVEICKSQFVFNPEKEGILAGAAKLATHEGPWQPVWERFCESPSKYPGIPHRIRQCTPPDGTLFWISGEGVDGWPQWNETKEKELLQDLLTLEDSPPKEARKKVLELEKKHRTRRQLIWAELGNAPLAQALEHLALMAEVTSNSLAAGTVDDLADGYLHTGWKADDALLRTLATIEKKDDIKAVCVAIRALYISWAEEAALYLQKVVRQDDYPGFSKKTNNPSIYEDKTCLLFVDGLRLDIAKKVSKNLSEQGFKVQEKACWAALPTVTATCKPAVSPIRDKIEGQEANTDFEPVIAETGQSLKGGHAFKKLLEANGWQVLDGHSSGSGEGKAWCEGSNIDHVGHNTGWKLAKQVESILQELMEQISSLLTTGWQAVHLVTDHGWLLLPGGLPKTELPAALVENKWGRCAIIKPGSITEANMYPWFWNLHVSIALAEGISCYRKGMEYTHGGLSLQECLTLELIVSKDTTAISSTPVIITDVVWQRLRCKVAVEGSIDGLQLDVRTQAGDPISSVVLTKKEFSKNGIASVVVEDEDLEGEEAFLVVLNHEEELVAQINTVIGGDIS